MKLSAVVLCVLVGCAVSLAVEHGPLISALQPGDAALESPGEPHSRNKRFFGLLAGIITAKAALYNALLTNQLLYNGYGVNRGYSYGSYGGYGGYGSYGGYGGQGSYGGHGGQGSYGGYGGQGSYGGQSGNQMHYQK